MRTRGNSARLVRPSWMMKLMAACQHFVLDVEMPNDGRAGDPTQKLLADLPPARTRVEELLHRVALARLAADYTLRTRARRSQRRGLLPDAVARILLDNSEPAAEAFARWSRHTFTAQAVQALAARVAKIIRSERSAGRLDLPGIARALDCSERDLREAFRRVYGLSPRRYHNTVRALHGVDVLLAAPTKISGMAEDFGFKSAKDVYRLMEEVTGLTPRRLRALSRSQAEKLRARLQKSLRLPGHEG